MTVLTNDTAIRPARRLEISWTEAGPFLALGALLCVGYLVNPDFLSATNLSNVITRSAFIAIIAVGATFVISAGGLDLSVGSMMAFVTGIMILTMNRLEPSMGANAILISLAVAAIGAFILYKTKYGRRCAAVGANEEVARYAGISIVSTRTIAYLIQGVCVAIAAICYVPRLGAATPTTGMLWELQVITAVVIGGTALRGGKGRIWGTIAGAVILELIANLMVLSDFVSEYLVAAVQGVIIIVAMLVQRFSK